MKTLMAIMIFASLAFGETTWTITWSQTLDRKMVDGQLVDNGYAAGYLVTIFDSNDVPIEEIDVKTTKAVYVGPDSICATVKAYDSRGNIGQPSDAVCEAVSVGGTFDINSDNFVNKKDADLWLVEYDTTSYKSVCDIDGDGDNDFDDLYALNIKVYDLTGGGMVTGADVTE